MSHHDIYIYIYIYIYINTIIYNNFLGFSHGQRLRPVDRVMLFPFRIETPFSSPFLRVAPLEPKGTLSCYGTSFLDPQ